MFFITELQVRPDGIVNATITTRSTLATGLAYYYQRASVAVASQEFLSVALTLQDAQGNIRLNECFDTCYQAEEE